MASRIVRKQLGTRIGFMATSERNNAKTTEIAMLSMYDCNAGSGERVTGTGVTVESPEKTFVLYLTPTAEMELAKGLLTNLLGRSITMAVDEEFRSVLRQCETAIVLQDKDAEHVVAALRRPATDSPKPHPET